MQLETKGHTTEMGGMKQDPSSFKIQNSAAAFRILSSGLYSDKITAIIREIVCNAFDIHVSTSQKNPFKIHLPTSLEPYFSVQDFGTGLAPEDMEELYVTYFASTKSDDDTNIGGFGLGCKSPFAYCSAFNVTSVFDGFEYTYSLMLNEDGMPAIVLMDEQPTTEHTGLTVSLPVKTNDIYEFHQKAARVLEFFEGSYEVNLSDFQARKVQHTHEGLDWAIRAIKSSVGDQPRAMVGKVAYRFDASSLTGLTPEQSMVLRLPIDLFFNVGELTVTPSRESLEMTKRTVSNLCARLQVIYDQVVMSLKAEIENAPSLWKAKILLRERMDSSNPFSPIIKKVIKSYFTQYAGFTMDEVSTSLKFRDFPGFTIYSREFESKRGYGAGEKLGKLTNCQSNYGTTLIETSDRVRFYVKDSKEQATRISKRIMEEAEENGEKILLYLLVPTTEDQKALSRDFNALVAGLGDPEVMFTSDLPALPKKPRGTRCASDTVNYCWKTYAGWHTKLNRNDWEKVKGEDLEGDGPFFYLPLENREIPYHVNNHDVAHAWASLRELGLTCEVEGEEYEFKDLNLWGLNAKGMEKVKDDNRWVNFLTYIKENPVELPADYLVWRSMQNIGLSMPQTANTSRVFHAYQEKIVSRKGDASDYYNSTKWINTFRDLVRGTDFHKQAVIVRRMNILINRVMREESTYKYWTALVAMTRQTVDLDENIPAEIKAYKDAYQPEVLKKYTLLNYIDFDYSARRSEEFGTEIGNYIANIG